MVIPSGAAFSSSFALANEPRYAVEESLFDLSRQPSAHRQSLATRIYGKLSRPMSASANASQTTTLIAGGGPAGMVLAFLLARAGIEVLVLEKHADFFRDFRGDTIHPSTFQLVYELGLLDDFLLVPHQELREIGAVIDDFSVTVANFSHLPVHCKFVGLMPQWDFLNFIAEKARGYPQFHLLMETEVTGLIIENNRVAG